jgi:RNA polymerase sigma-70 factor (ECF subfamily)
MGMISDAYFCGIALPKRHECSDAKIERRLGALASIGQQHLEPERGFERVDDLSRKYHGVLLRYFQRRGIQPSDAQDLAQEVFCRLAKQGALDDVARIEGYLFTIAANVANDMHRRDRVRYNNPVEEFVERVHVTDQFSPERQLAGRQELELVLAALNEMPERMRTVFVLARLENLTRSEIASRLGIARRTVEHYITQATACLADRRRKVT